MVKWCGTEIKGSYREQGFSWFEIPTGTKEGNIQILLSFLDMEQMGKEIGGELRADSYQASKVETFSIIKHFMTTITLWLKPFLFLLYLKE